MSKFQFNPEVTVGNLLTVLAIIFTVLITQVKVNSTVSELHAKQQQLETTLRVTQTQQSEQLDRLRTDVEVVYVRKDVLDATLRRIEEVLAEVRYSNSLLEDQARAIQ